MLEKLPRQYSKITKKWKTEKRDEKIKRIRLGCLNNRSFKKRKERK